MQVCIVSDCHPAGGGNAAASGWRACISLTSYYDLQVGDRFVLNCLGTSSFEPLMKHFLKRFAAGADRFEVGVHGSCVLCVLCVCVQCVFGWGGLWQSRS